MNLGNRDSARHKHWFGAGRRQWQDLLMVGALGLLIYAQGTIADLSDVNASEVQTKNQTASDSVLPSGQQDHYSTIAWLPAPD